MRVGIVGCGIVGAAIAYTLSKHIDGAIHVWDQRTPEQWQATGAALGVLMGVLRTKLKGKHLRLGLESLQAYEHLIPELEAVTGKTLAYNRQGILQLCFDPQDLVYWQKTQAVRKKQGFTLDILDQEQLVQRFPDMATAQDAATQQVVVGAVYSPDDRQLEPKQVTQALITAAAHNGVHFHWQSPVHGFQLSSSNSALQHVTHICSPHHETDVDVVIVASGLGAQALTTHLKAPIALQPVLGQAFSVLELPLPRTYPVVNGNDIHLYPRSDGSWGIGATVEFPVEDSFPPEPSAEALEAVHLGAIALYPPLAKATMTHTWSGLRPRPDGRAAPIIERLPGYANVIAATGHYRNGVLMAPVTAIKVLDLVRAISKDSDRASATNSPNPQKK